MVLARRQNHRVGGKGRGTILAIYGNSHVILSTFEYVGNFSIINVFFKEKYLKYINNFFRKMNPKIGRSD